MQAGSEWSAVALVAGRACMRSVGIRGTLIRLRGPGSESAGGGGGSVCATGRKARRGTDWRGHGLTDRQRDTEIIQESYREDCFGTVTEDTGHLITSSEPSLVMRTKKRETAVAENSREGTDKPPRGTNHTTPFHIAAFNSTHRCGNINILIFVYTHPLRIHFKCSGSNCIFPNTVYF